MGTTAAGAACDAVVPVDAFLLRFRGEPWIVEILRFMVPFFVCRLWRGGGWHNIGFRVYRKKVILCGIWTMPRRIERTDIYNIKKEY